MNAWVLRKKGKCELNDRCWVCWRVCVECVLNQLETSCLPLLTQGYSM